MAVRLNRCSVAMPKLFVRQAQYDLTNVRTDRIKLKRIDFQEEREDLNRNRHLP